MTTTGLSTVGVFRESSFIVIPWSPVQVDLSSNVHAISLTRNITCVCITQYLRGMLLGTGASGQLGNGFQVSSTNPQR